MQYSSGKLRTASTGAHWEAVQERATQTYKDPGESSYSFSTQLDNATMQHIAKQQCMQLLSQYNLIPVDDTPHVQTQTQHTPVYRIIDDNITKHKSPVMYTQAKQEMSKFSEQDSDCIKESQPRSTMTKVSNDLPHRLSQQFRSYAELLKQNLRTVNRAVVFRDTNKEMNIDVNILKGEDEFPITLLVDTGAQRSFISETFYEQKLATRIPKKRTFVRMYGVGGDELSTTGEVELDVAIGSEIVRQKFIIAKIKEEGILGFDFCQNHQAEWKWRDKEITLHGKERNRLVTEEDHTSRVMTRDKVEVPPRCEVIVSGIVEHASEAAKVGLVQPQQTFLESHGIG